MARYALVVGISQYCSPLKSLEKTATDAEAVAQVLEEYGDFVEVKRLPSRRNPQTQKREVVAKAVTGAELGQALQTLLLEQARQNEALIYFTGHGIIVSGNLGQPRGYLATSDCEIEADGKQIINQKHGIGFDELNDLISKSDLSSLVVLLDCCHSGDFLERNLIDHSFSAFRSQQKDYYLITAGRSFQPVYARRNEKHSVFTGALLRGLAAENANSERRVSGDRLFDHITQELRGTEQEPLRLGWGKSLTLVTHPPLVVPPTLDVPATTTVNRKNPYLGLRAFDSGQADCFFGRELAVRALLDRLSTGRFLAVIGPSGCGKSSLVKAGLLPYLQSDHIPGSSQWIVESFTPGTRPLESLQKALERQQQNQPLLLFIDQFEEVFTLCEDEAERRDFITQITEEVTSSHRFTRIIVAMRGDFLDRCAAYQEAAILINRTQPTTYFVTPFTLPELEEVIEKPADKHGVTFDRGLVPQIIADVMNQPGGLPLLQYALAELWRVCITESPSGESQLTCKGYEQIRGVKGALEKRANDLYQNLAPADKVFVRRLFLALVQLGEAQEVTRRRASWQDLEVEADSQEQLSRVTRQLASQEQRLIMTDEKTVEVAHEALLSEWGRLKEWIEQDRENLRLSRRLEAESKEWQRNNCSDEWLLTDAWLAAIDDWVKNTQPRLSQLEQEFLQESLKKRDRELQAKVDQERQLRELAESRQREAEAKAKAEKQRTRLASTVGVLTAFTLGFGLLAQHRENQVHDTRLLHIGSLIAEAQQSIDKGYELEALIASVKALRELKTIDHDQFKYFRDLQNIIYQVKERNRLRRGDTELTRLSFSPDGNTIASASKDGTIRLWKQNGEFVEQIKVSDQQLNGISFSPDGNIIASASEDGTIKLWNKTNESLKQLKERHKEGIWRVNFSPKSEMIASASYDGTIKIWDRHGKLLNTIDAKGGSVYSVSFSPDETVIASASRDGKIKIWTKNGSLLKEIKVVNNGRAFDVSFSPDGKTIASVGEEPIVKLWQRGSSWKDVTLWKRLEGHKDSVYSVSFSSKGSLASASGDGTVRIWSKEGNFLTSLNCHGFANDVKFNLKADTVGCVASENLTLWNIDTTYSKSSKSVNLDELLEHSCTWLHEYFMANPELKERNACDEVEI